MTEVVFALTALITYGRVIFSPRCHFLRDFCSFTGFAQERLELSPVSNVSLILRTWLLSENSTQNAEVDGERRSKRIKVCNGPVFDGEKPFVQNNSFQSSEVTKANRFIRLE